MGFDSNLAWTTSPATVCASTAAQRMYLTRRIADVVRAKPIVVTASLVVALEIVVVAFTAAVRVVRAALIRTRMAGARPAPRADDSRRAGAWGGTKCAAMLVPAAGLGGLCEAEGPEDRTDGRSTGAFK